jgi:hypothetical protein
MNAAHNAAHCSCFAIRMQHSEPLIASEVEARLSGGNGTGGRRRAYSTENKTIRPRSASAEMSQNRFTMLDNGAEKENRGDETNFG